MRINIRKPLALMLTLVMLCGLLPMGAVSVAAATTPVLDLDFNDGTNPFSGGSVVAEGPDGSKCLYWSAAGGYNAIYKTVSGVTQDTEFVITFKAKASVAATMGITIQNGGWGDYYTEKFTTSTSWTEYSITTNVGTYPTSNGGILFKFQDQGTAVNLWVDDLTMTEVVPESNAPDGENLVTNGDFETGDTTGWSKYQSTAVSTAAAYDGTYGVNLAGSGGWGGMLEQTLTVIPGSTYYFSLMYKTVSQGTNFTLKGSSTGTNYSSISSWITATEWTQIEFSFTAGDDSSVILNFCGGGTGTAESVYLDNVVMIKYPDASFDGYIYNGDFEIGTMQSWTCSQTATASADAAYSGNYGAHITNPGKEYGGMIHQSTVNVTAGKTYTVSYMMNVTVGYVNFQLLDGGAGSKTKLATSGYNSNAWKEFSFTVVPSTNVLCLNFCGGGTGTADEAYLDDIKVVEERDPSFDGYVTNGDFETGNHNPWVIYQNAVVDTTSARSGSYGMHLAGTGWGGVTYQTIKNLKAGKNYTLTFWIKAINNGLNITLKQDNTTGATICSGYYSTNNAGSWTQVTYHFTAPSAVAVLNFSGGGETMSSEMYLDDVLCVYHGSDPETYHRWGGNSIRDAADTSGTGYGLAFKFSVMASGGQRSYTNEYVASSASVNLDGTNYPVIRMGAVMTNQSSVGNSSANFTLDSVNGAKVIDIPAVYLCGLEADSVSFAVRILDIPDAHVNTEIYARPYYVYEEDGVEQIVYGTIRSNTYAKVNNPKTSIKILSIGNSFSKDVMETYMYDMFKAGGYEEVVIGYLYIAGCPMPRHLDNIENGLAAYEYGKNSNGTWVKTYNQTALSALQDEDWDYVTVHSSSDYIHGAQLSGYSNFSDDKYKEYTEYDCLIPIAEWVEENATNSSVKFDYHMIWAYSEGCDLWSFAYHNYNQLQMYSTIIAKTKECVVTCDAVNSIIPVGTAIQNGRTSFIGDNFNEPDATQGGNDGYHLNTKYGDFTGALTWYCHYSGDNASVIGDAGYKGQLTDDEFEAIAEAVNNAIASPYAITDSSFPAN